MNVFKKIILWLLGLIGLGILSAVILALFFERQIGEAFVAEINKSLKKEMKVESVNLSLLRNFPSASITLDKIEIPDTREHTLLEAEHLSLTFDILSIFYNRFDVKSILIHDGILNVFTDKLGNGNYDILKNSTTAASESSNSGDGGTIDFGVETTHLSNVKLIVADQRYEESVNIQLETLTFAGDITEERLKIDSYAEVFVEFIDIKGERFLPQKHLSYEANIEGDLEEGIYNFNKSRIYVEDNALIIDGSIKSSKRYSDFDMVISSEECSLSSVLSLIPESYLGYFKDFNSTGSFFVKSTIDGRLSTIRNPKIEFEFGLKNGRVNSPKLQTELDDVSFTVNYNNKEASKSGRGFVEVIDFNGKLNREPIYGSFFLENFADPSIDFRFDGALSLSDAFGLFDNEMIKDGGGKVAIKALHVEGKYNDMISLDRITNVVAKGAIVFNDAVLAIKEESVRIPQGELSMVDNDIEAKNIVLKDSHSDFELNGIIRNLIPVLLADSTNSQQAELLFDATLNSNNLDINKLMDLVTFDEQTVAPEDLDSLKTDETIRLERFTKLLKGKFKANFKALKWDKIEAKNIKGELAFNNNELIVRDAEMETMEGKIKMTSNVFFQEQPYMKAYFESFNLNGKQLFYQMDNFGQDILVADNLKGKFNTKMVVDIYWDEKGAFLYDKLYALADITIKEGELIDFEMMENFSAFLKMDDLKHIKFTNTRNQLEIKNSELVIPAMFIQNNAMNLTLAGRHTFDHKIDYKIKVNALQAMFSKFRKKNPDKKPRKAKKKGWFNTYVNVFGTVDDFDFKISKKLVKKALEEDLNREFADIQNNIKTRFEKDPIKEPTEWDDDVE